MRNGFPKEGYLTSMLLKEAMEQPAQLAQPYMIQQPAMHEGLQLL